MTVKRILIVLGIVLDPSLCARAERPELRPEKTYAVIAGVLRWKGSHFASFSTQRRKDKELYETLRARGVPADNMVLLLDEQATRDAIRQSLADAARRADDDSLLIFYYAGHGTKPGNVIYLANYDIDSSKPAETGLSVRDVAYVLKENFQNGAGRRVLLLADCCYSGGLAETARLLSREGVRAASLTSATASNTSTGNWTFTHAIVGLFRGEPLADGDGDGRITISEAATEIAAAMKYRELQRFGHQRHGLETDFVLARTNGARKPPHEPSDGFAVGSYVRAAGTPARLIAHSDKTCTVQIQQYSDRRTLELPVGRLQPFQFKRYPVGRQLKVMWGGRAWDAKVLEVQGDFHKIRYDGYSAAWDEWVLSNRVAGAQRVKPLDEKKARQRATVDGKYSKLLRRIEVEHDRAAYGTFYDYGHYQATTYAGHADLPAGYWVYVYPCWYIWTEQALVKEKKRNPPPRGR